MQRHSSYAFFFCLFLGISNGAIAQDGASADTLIQNGLAVLQQIDKAPSNGVWENAAAFIKTRFSKETLVDNLTKSRATIGQVAGRRWASVTRIKYDTEITGIPAGLYANIDFATDIVGGKTVFELVSFQLDANGVWRLTGYVPRNRQ